MSDSVPQHATIRWFMNETVVSFRQSYPVLHVYYSPGELRRHIYWQMQMIFNLEIFVIFWVFAESIMLMTGVRQGTNSENLHPEWERRLRVKPAIAATGRVACPSLPGSCSDWEFVTRMEARADHSVTAYPEILLSCSYVFCRIDYTATSKKEKSSTF